MNPTIYKAENRGHANHGWLNSHHTFSFASYYNPEKIHFGALRVLNDDRIDGGTGFPKHPHDNMEIISIPLYGDLAHEDSMGTSATIKENEVQVMSAGTGVVHSEFNHNKDKKTEFLQIWVFPKAQNVKPRYGQHHFKPEDRINKFQLIVSPNKEELDTWINQDAWFHLSNFKAGYKDTYHFKKKGNGLFLFLLEGELTVANNQLKKRDGISFTEVEEIEIQASSDANFLLMEVPLKW
ncbi:MAG: redox-sensitive bicupin YhaK (pirin superfamily) [Marivirga sp.]|jgi:redox-sensitive bicupin YhaK (pirin superfamily)